MTGPRLVEGGRSLEATEVESRVGAVADELRRAGVGRREPVAVALPHGSDAAVALLAVRRAHATALPLHPLLTAHEQARQIAHAGARLVLVDEPRRLPHTAAQVAVPGRPLPALNGEPAALDGDVLLYTSGTSGGAKGVLLSEDALASHARACASRILSGLGDVWVAPLTFAHAGGYTLLDRCARWGHALVFPGEEDLEAVIRRNGATHTSLVPTQFQRWVTSRGKYRTPPSLRCVLVGGGAADPDLLRRAHKWGVPARATYGATETCGQVATALEDTPPGSVGPTLRGVDVGLQGEDLHVRGPTLFRGYHADPDATRLALDQGWWRSGDLARYDEHGNLWILGRADDRITTGGEKVDPLEVERHLRTHPSVADAAVVGRPDPEWGQVVTAFVVARPGAAFDLAALRAHCQGKLAAFQVPKRLEIVPDLPRNAQGKVLRRALRA